MCVEFRTDLPTDLFLLRGKECSTCTLEIALTLHTLYLTLSTLHLTLLIDTIHPVFDASIIAIVMYRVVVLISLYSYSTHRVPVDLVTTKSSHFYIFILHI